MMLPGFFLPVNVASQYLCCVFGYECWGYHLHLAENCILMLSWHLVQRYSGSVFQPRKQICGVSFFELLTVSLVNTGS